MADPTGDLLGDLPLIPAGTEGMTGFYNLGNIRPVRPCEPPADDEVPTTTGARGKHVRTRSPTESNRCSTKSTRDVSTGFQLLLDQLLQQHVAELRAVGERRVERHGDRRKTEEMSMLSSDLKSQRSDKTFELEMLSWESKSEAGSAGNMLRKAKSTVADVMCKHHDGIPQLHASQILQIFEEQQEEEIPDAKPGPEEREIFPTETPSEFLTRYQQMSRMERLQMLLQSMAYEMLMIGLLCVNVMWMAVELQINGSLAGAELGVLDPMVTEDGIPVYNQAVVVGEIVFTAIFALDVTVRMLVLRMKFFKNWLNYIDLAVTVTSIFESTVTVSESLPIPPVLFRLLRLGKLARAIRVVSMTSVLASLQLLVKCLASSRDMLFWSFCLLTFVQCVAGMILSTLCVDFIKDEARPVEVRTQVLLYYGTFTRTILSMFEILFANWSPPCRILVENVSEWFAVFFLLYRCVLGFAVLNVVNSVFVQQTMKTASSDEDLAFKQKQRDAELYTKKVRKLFQTMDASGDGAINLEEFAKLVKSPKLRFWMSQLELEYHDLLSLFEFLDNGDGQITLSEFIDGAARLRGSAKALDIWRMETKVEVLFEEVLTQLRTGPGPFRPILHAHNSMDSEENLGASVCALSSVRETLDNSNYKHITMTAKKPSVQSSLGLDATFPADAEVQEGQGSP